MKPRRNVLLALLTVALLAAAPFASRVLAQQGVEVVTLPDGTKTIRVKDVKALRSEFLELKEYVTKLHEAKLPDKLFKQIELPDGTKIKMVDTAHPDYAGHKAKWKADMAKVEGKYAELDTRYSEVSSVKKKLGLGGKDLYYSGTERPGGCPTSDVDLTGSRKSCEKFIKELKANNPGLKVKEVPGGWEIPGKDMKIMTKEFGSPGTSTGSGYKEFVRGKAQWRSDLIAPEGGMYEITKGKLGVKDPKGAVTGYSQKFIESGATTCPELMDSHTAAKCVSKSADVAGTKAQNPEFFEKVDGVRGHKSLKEANVVDFGNAGEAEAIQKRQFSRDMKSEMKRAYKKSGEVTTEIEAVRDAKIKKLRAEPKPTPKQQTELVRLENDHVISKTSRQITLEEMATWDPEFVSEMVGGEKVTKTVHKDGSVTYKTADGKVLSQSQVAEQVLGRSRISTTGRIKAGLKRFFAPPPPGLRATTCKYAGYGMLLFMGYEGYHRGQKFIDPNASMGEKSAKTVWYTIYYGSGVPDMWDLGHSAGRDSMLQYDWDQIKGKDPSWVWAKLRSMGWSLGRLGKAMTIDPVAGTYKAGTGWLDQEKRAYDERLKSEEQQKRVQAYRDETLDKARRRLLAVIARAEKIKADAEALGNAQDVAKADEVLRKARAALAGIDKVAKGEGNVDERVKRLKDALALVDEATQDVLKLTKTETKIAEAPDFGLEDTPAEANVDAIIKWRDESLKTLQQKMATDPLREANKKACLALTGKPRKLTCPACGFSGEHWWFGDRWSCPRCEKCTMPSDLKRGGGLTFRAYAATRMKIYQDKMDEVREQARILIKEAQKK